MHPFAYCLIFMFCMCLFNACTISLTNISTHGVASDVVEEQLSATADVKADAKFSPIP